MADTRQILDAIYLAVDEVNLLLPPDKRLAKAEATPIVGAGASLDSLAFLNFVLLTEAKVNESCGLQVNLAEQLVENPTGEPPQTLGALASLVGSLQEG